ncbi:MAG: NHLP leader peptide family RiPP precursor [Syntrophus sp. (in: bacteria)]
MANDKEAQGKKLGEVIKKAWDDEAFMQRLLEDATPVLKEHGIQLPAGMKVKAVTNSENLSHLVVPPRPSTMLSDEDMDRVAAGIDESRSPEGALSGRDLVMSCNSIIIF